jgi:hypothetical protein
MSSPITILVNPIPASIIGGELVHTAIYGLNISAEGKSALLSDTLPLWAQFRTAFHGSVNFKCTVTAWEGYRYEQPVLDGGNTISNQYAFYCPALTVGALNWPIYIEPGSTNAACFFGGLQLTSIAQATATTDAVAGGRILTAGTGLTGGGDLTADRSFAIDQAFLAEFIDDEVALLIDNGTGLTWTYNDGTGSLTGNVSLSPFTTSDLAEGSNLYFTNERVDDRVSALIINSSTITWTYDDGANTLTASVVSDSNFSTATSSAGSTTAAGAPVYIHTDATFKKAKADNATTNAVVALAIADIADTVSGTLQSAGMLTLTTGQWDAITGGSGGLTPAAKYYLDPATAGKLTTTAPTTVGQFVTPVGIAWTTTKMCIRIGPTIAL